MIGECLNEIAAESGTEEIMLVYIIHFSFLLLCDVVFLTMIFQRSVVQLVQFLKLFHNQLAFD